MAPHLPAPSQQPTRRAPPPKQLVALPFDAAKLSGLSAKLITLHHDKNYAGAVKKLNLIRTQLGAADIGQAGSYWSQYGTLKAGEAAARNSALLHELYFENLAPAGQTPSPLVSKVMGQRFGGVDSMIQHMTGCAKATGGWVVLAFDATSDTIEVVPTAGHRGGMWHAAVLLVLDVFEHSYALDYGPNKGAYLSAFFRNINWQVVHSRLAPLVT